MTRATRAGVALAGVLLAVLGASGAWLWWNYRPDRDQWIRDVHRVSAIALLAVAVASVVVAVLRRRQTRAAGVVAAIGLLVTVGAAYVLGRLLPYDQLALWAVTPSEDFHWGIAGTFDNPVKYLIVRSREVSVSTYHWWAYAHLVLSALAVVALVLVWFRLRERGISPRTREPATAPEPLPRG